MAVNDKTAVSFWSTAEPLYIIFSVGLFQISGINGSKIWKKKKRFQLQNQPPTRFYKVTIEGHQTKQCSSDVIVDKVKPKVSQIWSILFISYIICSGVNSLSLCIKIFAFRSSSTLTTQQFILSEICLIPILISRRVLMMPVIWTISCYLECETFKAQHLKKKQPHSDHRQTIILEFQGHEILMFKIFTRILKSFLTCRITHDNTMNSRLLIWTNHSELQAIHRCKEGSCPVQQNHRCRKSQTAGWAPSPRRRAAERWPWAATGC